MKTPPALEVQPLLFIGWLRNHHFFQMFFSSEGVSSSTRKQIIFSKCFLTSMALDYTFRSIHDVVYLIIYTVTILTININNIHVGTSTVPIFMNPMGIISRDHHTSWDPNRRCEGLSVDTRWCSGHRGERFGGQQLTVRHVVVTRDDLGVFVGCLKKAVALGWKLENQGFSSQSIIKIM